MKKLFVACALITTLFTSEAYSLSVNDWGKLNDDKKVGVIWGIYEAAINYGVEKGDFAFEKCVKGSTGHVYNKMLEKANSGIATYDDVDIAVSVGTQIFTECGKFPKGW